jgi:prepilin-type N-terminal cleavage/methylation domain-containing protein
MTAGLTVYPRTRCRRPRALRCSRHAFTLVEMLVVIGLIVVLLAMLMPAIAGARQKAAAAACASNERQIYQASVAFALDHAGRLPVPSWVQETVETTTPEFQAAACWVDLKTDPPGGQINFLVGGLWPYLGTRADVNSRKAIVNCPGERDERSLWGGQRALRNFSYSYNSNIRDPGVTVSVGTAVRLAAVLHPGDKIMIYEELGPNDAWCTHPEASVDDVPAGRHGSLSSKNTKRDVSTGYADRWPAYFNNGLGNHCFFDGHVELLTPRWIVDDKGRNKDYRSWGPLTTETWPTTAPVAPPMQ